MVWIGNIIGIVVPYIGTWIETSFGFPPFDNLSVVPYIGTWIETVEPRSAEATPIVVPYIGTWIETAVLEKSMKPEVGRTLYRYVD